MKASRHILILIALAFLPGALAAQTNPPVTVSVASESLPTFEVRTYRVEGETVFPPEKLSAALTNYTGTVSLKKIQAGLALHGAAVSERYPDEPGLQLCRRRSGPCHWQAVLHCASSAA